MLHSKVVEAELVDRLLLRHLPDHHLVVKSDHLAAAVCSLAVMAAVSSLAVMAAVGSLAVMAADLGLRHRHRLPSFPSHLQGH